MKLEDLEFQNERLVKINGERILYMDGFQLIEYIRQIANLLHETTEQNKVGDSS